MSARRSSFSLGFRLLLLLLGESFVFIFSILSSKSEEEVSHYFPKGLEACSVYRTVGVEGRSR